jgi:hypothetical protein
MSESTKINCPVCGRTEIEGDICPNCETDLAAIVALSNLPLANTSDRPSLLVNIGIIVTAILTIELGLHTWSLLF